MGVCYGKNPGAPSESPTAGSGLEWDPNGKVLAQGSNKSVYSGSYSGEKAVICLARDTNEVDIKRAKNEIDVLKAMGHNASSKCSFTGITKASPTWCWSKSIPSASIWGAFGHSTS